MKGSGGCGASAPTWRSTYSGLDALTTTPLSSITSDIWLPLASIWAMASALSLATTTPAGAPR